MVTYENLYEFDEVSEPLKQFIDTILIPELLDWVFSEKYDFLLVPFFNFKRVRFEVVLRLSAKHEPLKNALHLAVEITKTKIVKSSFDSNRGLQQIKFLDSLRVSEAGSLPDSVIVFRPADHLLEEKYKNSISKH